MPAKLLTLEQWAADTYGAAAPHINTLRRWARDGHIFPVPLKHGRSYFVAQDALYVGTAGAAAAAGGMPKGRLVARLMNGR